MKLILIRHLPTEWNKKTLLQGRQDISISPPDPGLMEEIIATRIKLDSLGPFSHVLSSRLKRTQETAFLYGYQPEPEPLLDELDFGPFEGKPKALLLEHFGDDWLHAPASLALGEKISDLEARIHTFLNQYKEADTVLAFGHGAWIRALLSWHKSGHLNEMNLVAAANNECFILDFNDAARKEAALERDAYL